MLLPNVAELLKSVMPLRVEPASYVFTDGQGRPIDQSEFNRCSFQPVLRVINLRPRPFYNTRHTFIGVALAIGLQSKVDRPPDRNEHRHDSRALWQVHPRRRRRALKGVC